MISIKKCLLIKSLFVATLLLGWGNALCLPITDPPTDSSSVKKIENEFALRGVDGPYLFKEKNKLKEIRVVAAGDDYDIEVHISDYKSKDKYLKQFKQYTADKKKLTALIERNSNSSKESDFLRFQLEEFNTLGLIAGEQAQMEGSLNQLRNADGIKSKTAAAYNLLIEDENALIPQLRSIAHSLADIKKDYKKLEGSVDRYDSIIIELEDIAEEFNSIGEDTEHDPQRLQEIQERLDFIYKLQNKHSVKTDADLLQVQQTLNEQLNDIGDLSAEIENLESQIVRSEVSLKKLATNYRRKEKK